MATETLKQHKDLTGTDLHVNKLHAETHHSGGTDPLEYVHSQILSLATWTITHNLLKYPAVMVVDTGGNVVIGEVQYISLNQLVITFSAAFSGKAYLS
jgi:hypothetical protein